MGNGERRTIAFGLLAFVGFRMIQSGLSEEASTRSGNPTRGKLLVILSVATSVDALAVGLSLAFFDVDVVLPSVIIGFVTFVLLIIGIQVLSSHLL